MFHQAKSIRVIKALGQPKKHHAKAFVLPETLEPEFKKKEIEHFDLLSHKVCSKRLVFRA